MSGSDVSAPFITVDAKVSRKGGCSGIFLLGFMTVFFAAFAVVFTLICANFFYLGTKVTKAEWVIDVDSTHPDFARAVPITDAYGVTGGRNSEQMLLDLSKPFTFPVGCVRTNNTKGDFGPKCPQ
jgi:hypothetical protein